MFRIFAALGVVSCFSLSNALAQEEADILIADFEESRFSKWQQEGAAFKLPERKNLSVSHLNKITFSAEVSGTDKVLINKCKVYPMKSILKKSGE
jgi:hypothetical protein